MLFYVAYLRVVECADVLDGFSLGRKVGKTEANDTFRGLESSFRLELSKVVEQWPVDVTAVPEVIVSTPRRGG